MCCAPLKYSDVYAKDVQDKIYVTVSPPVFEGGSLGMMQKHIKHLEIRKYLIYEWGMSKMFLQAP